MKGATRSIRARLVLFALAGTLVALALAALGLVALFDRHVERRVGQELDSHIAQIAGQLRIGADDALTLAREPSDPRFQRPLSGLYWQVRDDARGALLRSRSLWDADLAMPEGSLTAGETRIGRIAAPDGHDALLHEKAVVLVEGGIERPARIAVALDRTELKTLRAGFAQDLVPGLALLAALILIATWWQIGAGLRPLSAIQSGIEAVRSGRARRLDTDMPREISPLITEVNSLLAAQEEAMARARDRAADLAHGLRTPLTALSGDAARLRARGEHALAHDIETLAAQMRRTIERELTRARLRHQGPAKPVPLRALADGIIRTLKRTPNGEAIDFENGIPADVSLPLPADDLAEMLGNLLENASRFAHGKVRIASERAADGVTITVEDDGDGVDPDAMEQLAVRGRRSDQAGSAGLGLAIVDDILSAYGGTLGFMRSGLGGLGLHLRVPLRET
jgi:signal transduction histidine kinase